MVSVVLIGSGNVAQHLIAAFLQSDDVELVQVFSRKKEEVAHLLPNEKITADFSTLKQADVYIIAVKYPRRNGA